MKKGNLIFIVGGLGLLYYYFTRKKTAILPPVTKIVPSTTNIARYEYPEGLFELDFVANGVETAQLYKGQLRAMTAAYAQMYAPNHWAITKIIPDIIYRSIPRGATLDV